MGTADIQSYFLQYGLLFLFIVILLEYLNLPGFPAGIILPVAGIWASATNVSLFVALFVSVIAALLASWILYFVGYFFGDLLISKITTKYPKFKLPVDKCYNFINEKGSIGIFIAKLLPAIRTLISIPAGITKMNFLSYTISSTGGIIIWNFVLMGAGYFFSDQILPLLG